MKRYTWKSISAIILSGSAFLLLTALIDAEVSTAVYFLMALVPLLLIAGSFFSMIVIRDDTEKNLLAFISFVISAVTTIWIIFFLLLTLLAA